AAPPEVSPARGSWFPRTREGPAPRAPDPRPRGAQRPVVPHPTRAPAGPAPSGRLPAVRAVAAPTAAGAGRSGARGHRRGGARAAAPDRRTERGLSRADL